MFIFDGAYEAWKKMFHCFFYYLCFPVFLLICSRDGEGFKFCDVWIREFYVVLSMFLLSDWL